MEKSMKALSVLMPWAGLIMYCGKDVENRTWCTNYRGRILIHASKKPEQNYNELLDALTLGYAENYAVFRKKFLADCGNIIGSVELIDCVRNSESRWAESGMWHWVLKDAKPCKLIPVKGALGLWEYTGLHEAIQKDERI
jgi:hypothetical protein